MTLPPLPEPAYPGAQRLGFKLERAFSASEMRAYGEACAMAEREALIALASTKHWAMKDESPFEDAVREICDMRA